MFKTCVDHILREIRKQGVLALPKIGICKLFSIWENRAPWPVKVRFWHHLMRLIFLPNYKKKRILGIWDYKALPWSIGDPLLFIEMLSIQKIKNDAEEIDICVVYDRENPGGNRRGSNLTPDNAQDYMLDFLPLFSTCPFLGSIFQFNSREEFYHFLRRNSERYETFPTLGQHISERYNFHKNFPHWDEIREFYNTYGFVPYLRIGERDISWARWFYQSHLPKNAVPVVLSLRQTLGDSARNADPLIWLSFIDKCKTVFPEVVFVIVGLKEEIFKGMREKLNVIIAKDFGTSIMEDLALIRISLLYMGTGSGVNEIARFSDLPYLLFQISLYDSKKCLGGVKPGESGYGVETDKQKIFSSTIKVTPELLFNEFKALYSKLDRNKWRSLALENARIKHGHPSAVVEKNE